jgi:hypothetical protein
MIAFATVQAERTSPTATQDAPPHLPSPDEAQAKSSAAGVESAYPPGGGGAAAAANVMATAPELAQACIDTAAAYKLGPNLTKSQIVTLNADENKS